MIVRFDSLDNAISKGFKEDYLEIEIYKSDRFKAMPKVLLGLEVKIDSVKNIDDTLYINNYIVYPELCTFIKE